MIRTITRSIRALGKDTACFLATVPQGAGLINQTSRLPQPQRFQALSKGMNQPENPSNSNTQHPANFRRVKSEEHINFGFDSCTQSARAFDQQVYNAETSVFNNYLGPGDPNLMSIPLPKAPRAPKKFYLQRSCSSGGHFNHHPEVSSILKVLQRRCWKQVKCANTPAQHNFQFTLMSYNVLAQKLLDEHPHLYQNHDSEHLAWKTRWRNLFNEIKTLRPDILCLQEVQQTHLNYFKDLEILGFKGIYKKRTGARCDGCAIYYKPDRLRLVEFETVEFFQPNVSILDRDNIAIVAKFCPKNRPDDSFIVATTHLLYNPKREDVRLAQVQLLLTEVERMSYEGNAKYLPIILTGDFNSSPNSPVHTLITKGSLKYSHLAQRKMDEPKSPCHGPVLMPSSLQITDQCQHACLLKKRLEQDEISRAEEAALIKLFNTDKTVPKIRAEAIKSRNLFSSGTLSHLFAFKSVYCAGTNENPEATTFQDQWITVDYIFYTGKKEGEEIKEHQLNLVSVYRLPFRSELGTIKIPNSLMGSDHLCLAAKFMLAM